MNINDDDIETDLDAEFRQILYIIKPYINDINDHYRLERYRVWLEKLSTTSAAEKLERNKYLIELANQIHDDVLKPPFTFNPRPGPLPRLRRVDQAIVTTFHDSRFEEEQAETDWPYIPPRRTGQNLSPRVNKGKEQIKKIAKPRMVTRPFQTIGRPNDEMLRNSETSSWCDLSESTTSVNADGEDTDVDQDEQKTSRMRPDNMTEAERPFSAEETTMSKQQARQELEALKMRIKDLLEVKNALKDTHILSEDRKKTIDNLQNKLTRAEKENAELKSLLESQKKKFMELDKTKTKELNEFKDKLASLRQKEIDRMKQQYQEQIKTIEKSHSSKMSLLENEISSKIEAVKSEYDAKIKQLTESNAQLLNEKEAEIRRLKDELRSRGDASINEQNSEQIINLKRCLSKLDKALHKNEKDYVKKIEKLKQELEMRDMTSKMQLQTQRADLMVKNTASKQQEMKNALDSLEEKYKKMMESLQMNAFKAKKHDEMLIQELKSILEKNNVTY